MRWLVTAVGVLMGAGMAQAAQPAPCKASQISLAVDGENGNFDGMSQSGVLVVVRNLGSDLCTVPGLPKLGFEDASHRALTVVFEAPKGMHPGPVVMPVAVPPGAEATGEMRWVSGDVYDGHNCLKPAMLTYTIGSEVQRIPFQGQICGPAGKAPAYKLTWFKRDPVYVPKP